MTREKENYNAFLLHFLERLNGCESIENKITESLTDICEYYGFKRGFIYQTDGFRYFYRLTRNFLGVTICSFL